MSIKLNSEKGAKLTISRDIDYLTWRGSDFQAGD